MRKLLFEGIQSPNKNPRRTSPVPRFLLPVNADLRSNFSDELLKKLKL